MTRRHRPRYLLWLPSGYVATRRCHYGRPVRLDRQLPASGRGAS